MKHFRLNQAVKMNDNALENYGYEYENIFIVTHRAHSYMPAKEFYAKNMPEGYHPGYDDGVKGQWLYDLKYQSTNEDLNFSLYDWELESI